MARLTACALLLACCGAAPAGAAPPKARSWSADNGNGTYSNPLFYDEFSDPDMIRVGPDYYLTGTTMHTMPGLPVLHSQDLVNWRIIGYAFERLDLGPDFRLEEGKEIYGQGLWAPCFRYHNGTYYIFANVNRFGLQVFRAAANLEFRGTIRAARGGRGHCLVAHSGDEEALCIVNGHGTALRGADVVVDANLNAPEASGNPWGGAAPSFEVVANSAQTAAGSGYPGPHPVGQRIPVKTRNGAAYIEVREVGPSETLVLVNRP